MENIDMEERTQRKLKLIIGRAERMDFPDGEVFGVPAKIDTGAYRSSVWASNIREEDGELTYTLLGPESPYYSGIECRTTKYERVEVENSFGQKEERYSLTIRAKVGAKIIRSNFTLSDRSSKTYPVLIGRRFLKGRYLVDVAEGDPMDDEESSAS
jgi:hypothetical protein